MDSHLFILFSVGAPRCDCGQSAQVGALQDGVESPGVLLRPRVGPRAQGRRLGQHERESAEASGIHGRTRQ